MPPTPELFAALEQLWTLVGGDAGALAGRDPVLRGTFAVGRAALATIGAGVMARPTGRDRDARW